MGPSKRPTINCALLFSASFGLPARKCQRLGKRAAASSVRNFVFDTSVVRSDKLKNNVSHCEETCCCSQEVVRAIRQRLHHTAREGLHERRENRRHPGRSRELCSYGIESRLHRQQIVPIFLGREPFAFAKSQLMSSLEKRIKVDPRHVSVILWVHHRRTMISRVTHDRVE